MRQINLKMGQSTVLRFREKPKKVVVGNQNYFNIEFIDNDITVQPLGLVTSNLFVYGEFHTFGLILKVGNSSNYDDLVNVRWKSLEAPLPQKPKKKSQNNEKSVNIAFKIGSELRVKVNSMKYDSVKSLYLMDLEIENLSKQTLDTKDIRFNLTRSKKALSNQKYVFEKNELAPNAKCRVRFILKLEKKSGFTLNASLKENKGKTIIFRRYL